MTPERPLQDDVEMLLGLVEALTRVVVLIVEKYPVMCSRDDLIAFDTLAYFKAKLVERDDA